MTEDRALSPAPCASCIFSNDIITATPRAYYGSMNFDTPMHTLKSLDRVIEKIERSFIILSLSLMTGLTFLLILLRSLYTYGHIQWANTLLGQVGWTDPLVRLLVLWVTFLGASLITGENRHIKIDIMGSLLPSRWMPFRGIILNIGCIVICSLMVKASIEYIHVEMQFGSSLFLSVPSWILQLILPAGFSVMVFRFFINALEQSLGLARKNRS
jgi:TRAP-type C4-dicarboxylate transport system permease small subunit